jgi:hypothetical protein
VYPETSASFFKNELVTACLDMKYVGFNYWHQMTEAQHNGCDAQGWGGLGNRQAGTSGGYAQDDPNCVSWGKDARRKSLAAMYARDEVISPFRTGSLGLSKPLNPQHG